MVKTDPVDGSLTVPEPPPQPNRNVRAIKTSQSGPTKVEARFTLSGVCAKPLATSELHFENVWKDLAINLCGGSLCANQRCCRTFSGFGRVAALVFLGGFGEFVADSFQGRPIE